MNWKTTLFATFWIFNSILMIGLSSCDNGPKTENVTEKQKPITDFRNIINDTVSVKLALTDIAAYNSFMNLQRVPKRYNITNFKVESFTIPIAYLDSLAKLYNLGTIMQNEKVWAMLALNPATGKAQTITLYMFCTNKAGQPVYYDITNTTALTTIDTTTAKANVLAYQKMIGQFNPTVDTFKLATLLPYGHAIPWADLQDLDGNALNGDYIYANLVIKGKMATPNDSISLFIKANLPIGSIKADGGGNTYFDFTDPCPNLCPPGYN